ncbi:MAG: hypothetical protein LBK69_08195 [Syntrophomonadaceae bacterium]|jgi:hypothetical protein|nr:hypothetical protein [Syntrophomonadaceae bacterium]
MASGIFTVFSLFSFHKGECEEVDRSYQDNYNRIRESKDQAYGMEVWSWAQLFKAEIEMLETNPALSHAVETIKQFSKDKEAWLQFEAKEKARADYRIHMTDSRALWIFRAKADLF